MDSFQENNNLHEQDGLNIIKELQYYLFFWPWFLLSVIIFFTSSFIYLRYTNTSFITTATLQVKDSSSDPSSFLSQNTGTGTMFNLNRTKIDNYIAQIKANKIIKDVVESLDLQTTIYNVGRIKESIVFIDKIPFKIEFKKYENFYQKILKFK